MVTKDNDVGDVDGTFAVYEERPYWHGNKKKTIQDGTFLVVKKKVSDEISSKSIPVVDVFCSLMTCCGMRSWACSRIVSATRCAATEVSVVLMKAQSVFASVSRSPSQSASLCCHIVRSIVSHSGTFSRNDAMTMLRLDTPGITLALRPWMSVIARSRR